MEKINITELLKDCPKGMKLDCTMYDDVYFDYVDELNIIHCYIQHETHRTSITLNQHGTPNSDIKSKCVIFPKGKTTWEGFVPPCQFKDGDIVVSSLDNIHILKNRSTSYIYVDFAHNSKGSLCKSLTTCVRVIRLATEEEKAKLFKVIKDNGYRWNEETKTLEKLVKHRFKVGDRIRHKNDKTIIKTIGYVYYDSYALCDGHLLLFADQDMWELAPDKFNINTLKPFDKVLVRNHEKNEWQPNFFNKYCKEINSFKLIGICTPSYTNSQHFVNYCIPYEGNEHLSGKVDDCAEYFKTWK